MEKRLTNKIFDKVNTANSTDWYHEIEENQKHARISRYTTGQNKNERIVIKKCWKEKLIQMR